MPRGGKRPGAGAPKGNWNAFKHGRRSRQWADMIAKIARVPGSAEAFRRYADRAGQIELDDTEAGFLMFGELFKHAADIAQGIDSDGPFRKYLKNNGRNVRRGRSNVHGSNATRKRPMVHQSKKNAPKTVFTDTAGTLETKNAPTSNQTADTTGENNRSADTKPARKSVD